MISLCTFVKNEENCIGHMIESVKDLVDEIVVVDTGSTDETISICKGYGARVYHGSLRAGFGELRTLAAHLAREPWVLMLDADETLHCTIDLQAWLQECPDEAYAIARKRWLDLEMTEQTELEAYPDFQVRIFRNNPSYIWRRELHEYFHGAAVCNWESDCLYINHFHDVFKSSERLKERDTLYSSLAAKAGVTKEGGHKL